MGHEGTWVTLAYHFLEATVSVEPEEPPGRHLCRGSTVLSAAMQKFCSVSWTPVLPRLGPVTGEKPMKPFLSGCFMQTNQEMQVPALAWQRVMYLTDANTVSQSTF